MQANCRCPFTCPPSLLAAVILSSCLVSSHLVLCFRAFVYCARCLWMLSVDAFLRIINERMTWPASQTSQREQVTQSKSLTRSFSDAKLVLAIEFGWTKAQAGRDKRADDHWPVRSSCGAFHLLLIGRGGGRGGRQIRQSDALA